MSITRAVLINMEEKKYESNQYMFILSIIGVLSLSYVVMYLGSQVNKNTLKTAKIEHEIISMQDKEDAYRNQLLSSVQSFEPIPLKEQDAGFLEGVRKKVYLYILCRHLQIIIHKRNLIISYNQYDSDDCKID